MMIKKTITLMISVVFVLTANTLFAEVLTAPPEEPDAAGEYLFYLHGRIVEGSDGRPVSSEYGPYEYYEILNTFSQEGFIVISEIREQDCDSDSYALKVEKWITDLMEKGVPSENISVVGASKGGYIASKVSSDMQEPCINYVILAGLFADPAALKTLRLSGRVLSVHDSGDKFPIVPEKFFSNSPDLKDKKNSYKYRFGARASL